MSVYAAAYRRCKNMCKKTPQEILSCGVLQNYTGFGYLPDIREAS